MGKKHQLEEALILLQKGEAICRELSNIVGLGYCYWQWASLARAHADGKTEKEKLEWALAIFTELKMPIERDAVQAELDKVHAVDAGLRPRKESASTSENTVF